MTLHCCHSCESGNPGLGAGLMATPAMGLMPATVLDSRFRGNDKVLGVFGVSPPPPPPSEMGGGLI